MSRSRGADEERAAAALVVGGERDELEDPLDVAVLEARFEQPVGGRAADEALGARAGVDPGRLDADDAPHALAGGSGDPDQRDHLLRRELRHRRSPLVRVARGDPHLSEQRLLPVDDAPRHVLREVLDEERVVLHDALDRLLEELGETRHVDALLPRVEVDRAVDRRRDELLAAAAPDADGLLDARHADAREAERHFRRRRLQIRCLGALHPVRLDPP